MGEGPGEVGAGRDGAGRVGWPGSGPSQGSRLVH